MTRFILILVTCLLAISCETKHPELEHFAAAEFNEIAGFTLDELQIGSAERIVPLGTDRFIVLDRTANRLHEITSQGESASLRLDLPSGTDISSIATSREGELYVMNAYQGEVHVLSESDEHYWEHQHTIRFEEYVAEMPRRLEVSEENIFIKSFSHGSVDDGRTTGKLYVFDHDGNPEADDPVEFPLQDLTRDPMRQSGMPIPVPFSNTTLLAVNSRGTAFMGWTDELQMTGYSTDGLETFSLSYNLDPVSTESEDLEEWLETMGPELRATIEAGMPDYLPVMHHLAISNEDEIWIQFQATGTSSNTLVFDPDGEPVFKLRIPVNFEIDAIYSDRIIGVERDGTGTQTVRLFEVE